MELRQYTKKPRTLTGVLFDGSRSSAGDIGEWVRSATGMQTTMTPATAGQFRLYVPTPAGTQLLNPGDVLLQDGDTYYPINSDDLDMNYDDTTPTEAPS